MLNFTPSTNDNQRPKAGSFDSFADEVTQRITQVRRCSEFEAHEYVSDRMTVLVSCFQDGVSLEEATQRLAATPSSPRHWD